MCDILSDSGVMFHVGVALIDGMSERKNLATWYCQGVCMSMCERGIDTMDTRLRRGLGRRNDDSDR